MGYYKMIEIEEFFNYFSDEDYYVFPHNTIIRFEKDIAKIKKLAKGVFEFQLINYRDAKLSSTKDVYITEESLISIIFEFEKKN